ncbi:hypothetical protein OPIT5_15910 [Opitutaceae bacterium TAV5]|nr:hypothetical protein OPIT5_15910 [Opitutaceae bacterium TAV5]
MPVTSTNLARLLLPVLPALPVAILLGATAAAAPDTRAIPEMPRYGQWQSAYIGGGGWLQEIILCPSDPNRVYSYVDISGMFRSDDGGNTWRMIHGGLPKRRADFDTRSMHVDPRNADILLAALSGRMQKETVYRSNDGGNTWKTVITGAPFWGNILGRFDGPLIVHQPDAPDNLLIATGGGGLYKSSDNGDTWRHVEKLKDVGATGLLVDRRDPRRVWLWARGGKIGTAGWVAGTFEGGFFESRDFGETWQKVSDVQPTKMVQDPQNHARFYAIFNDRIIKTSDDGRSWTELANGLNIDRANLDKPIPTSMGDIYYHAIDTGPDFVLAASGRGTFYRLPLLASSPADAVKWEKVERKKLIEPDYGWARFPGGNDFGRALGWVRVDPRDPHHWFFTDWYSLYQSPNAGETWQLTIHGIESTFVHTLLADPANPQRIHLGMSDNGYFRSEDGGVSYRKVGGRNFNSSNIKWLDLSSENPNKIVAVGTPGGEWKCTQVFLSDNAGETWRFSPMKNLPDMTDRRCHSITVHPKNPDEVWLAVSGKITPGQSGPWRSRDGGISWEWSGEGLPEGEDFFNNQIWLYRGSEIAVSPDGSLLAVNGRTNELWRRGPADNSRWERIAFPAEKPGHNTALNPALQNRPWVMAVADTSVAGRFYAGVSRRGLWRSDDSGTTWQRVFDGQLVSFSLDRLRSGQIACSDWDTVWFSADNGGKWIDLDAERKIPFRPVNIVLPVNDRILIGTFGNGAFHRPLPAYP